MQQAAQKAALAAARQVAEQAAQAADTALAVVAEMEAAQGAALVAQMPWSLGLIPAAQASGAVPAAVASDYAVLNGLWRSAAPGGTQQQPISTPAWARQDDGGRAAYSVQSPPRWASQGLDGGRATQTNDFSLPPASAAPPVPSRQRMRSAPGTEYLGIVPGPKAQASSVAPTALRGSPPVQLYTPPAPPTAATQRQLPPLSLPLPTLKQRTQQPISTPTWARQDDGGRAAYSVQSSPPRWASQGLDGGRATPTSDFPLPPAYAAPLASSRQRMRAAPGTEYLGMLPGAKAQGSSVARPYAPYVAPNQEPALGIDYRGAPFQPPGAASNIAVGYSQPAPTGPMSTGILRSPSKTSWSSQIPASADSATAALAAPAPRSAGRSYAPWAPPSTRK
jgi:hypothetical protein